MTKPNLHQTRESWLTAATSALRSHYATAGYPLPDRIRFAIGFTSTGRRGKRIGEHWHSLASADDHHEIYIRPDQADPAEVLGILSHELVHSAVPIGSGHGPIFKAAALAVGLTGPMRSALPGPVLAAKLAEIAAELGPLPHASLNWNSTGKDDEEEAPKSDDAPKKQTARMIKCECAECGYIVRASTKWIMTAGAPHCPQHGAMAPDFPTEDEETGSV